MSWGRSVPFKANAERRHHIPKQRHRVTNSAAYDAALRQRGSLTIWFTDAAIAAWKAEPRTTRGGQPRYSALAITAALTLRAVFRLALRQTEGLIGSIIALLGLDLAVPDHTTLSRRAESLDVVCPWSCSGPVHLLVDSTGLKLCGSGEWLLEKHGTRTRRSWRKLVWGFLCQAVIGVFLFGSEKDWGGRSEGSSPSGARSSRRNLVFGDPIGSDHDAAMRIGSEAPGRRAHSAQRLSGHACARVATTSDRHRRFVTRAWRNPEFGWLSFRP